MSKKLPHQISVEELLASLETADDTLELISFSNDVPNFLSKFKIESGSNFIRPSLLYKLYRLYSQEPLNQHTFTRSCSEFVHSNGKYFMLNISPLKLTKILNPPTNQNLTSSASIKTHYEAFLEGGKITKGSKYIEGFLFFELYRFYCIDNRIKNRLRYENFISISKLYFEHKRIGSSKGFWYRVDPRLLDILGEEHILKVRESRKMTDKHKLLRKPKEIK